MQEANRRQDPLRQEKWNPRKWDGKSAVPSSALWFRSGSGEIKIKGDGEEKTFSMDGYTGGIMKHPWFGDVVINIEGVDIEGGEKTFSDGRKKTSVLREHRSDWIVGYGYASNSNGHISLEDGTFSKVTHHGREVAGLCGEGYPWECSIHIDEPNVIDLRAGKTMNVNGRAVKGPAIVFDKSRLREVSFCSLGIDADTSAAISAAKGDEVEIVILTETNNLKDNTMSNDTAGAEPEEASTAPDIDVKKLESDARDEGEKAVRAEFASLCDAYGDFGVEMFKAGKSLDEAKDLYLAHLKEKNEALEAEVAKFAAKPDEAELEEPVKVGQKPDEDAPKSFRAAAERYRTEAKSRGEELTLSQAMKFVHKKFPDLDTSS